MLYNNIKCTYNGLIIILTLQSFKSSILQRVGKRKGSWVTCTIHNGILSDMYDSQQYPDLHVRFTTVSWVICSIHNGILSDMYDSQRYPEWHVSCKRCELLSKRQFPKGDFPSLGNYTFGKFPLGKIPLRSCRLGKGIWEVPIASCKILSMLIMIY